MIFEISNPSDPITFEADDLNVARAVVLLLGHGKYGLEQIGGESSLVPFLMFCGEKEVEDYLKDTFGNYSDYLIEHHAEIVKALESVLTMKAGPRQNYMLAMSLIDDPIKRQKYRDEIQDRERSSMNDIAGRAWQIARDWKIEPAAPASGKG